MGCITIGQYAAGGFSDVYSDGLDTDWIVKRRF